MVRLHHLVAQRSSSSSEDHNQDHLACMVIPIFTHDQDSQHPLGSLKTLLLFQGSRNEKSLAHITCLCLQLHRHFQFITPHQQHLRSMGRYSHMVKQGQSHMSRLQRIRRQGISWRHMRSLPPPRLHFGTHRCNSVVRTREQARLSQRNRALRNEWRRRGEGRLDGCNARHGNVELVPEPRSRTACDAHTDIRAPPRVGHIQPGRYSAAPCHKLGPRWRPSTSSTIIFT